MSTYQGDINWNQVKADGVDFAFIRLGARGWGTAGTMFTDAKYEANMKGSIAAGVDRGVYFFSQAINVAEAKEESPICPRPDQGIRCHLSGGHRHGKPARQGGAHPGAGR